MRIQIRLIRNRFKSDYKIFYKTGCLCCYEDFGPSNEGKPYLSREGLSQGEYTVGALTTRLIEKPASMINGSALETWPTSNWDGEIDGRDSVGVTELPFMKSEARYWDDTKREGNNGGGTTSNAINYSFRMGHHILPKI
ncbi:hypothetical protein PHMEG_00030379 [Phytophthora megakarya]|uniref:Uncharacterized protein n=1 Tax=Phytophthora megakarya TaxID=4795 RepID=A0A225V0S7_9STRA|nr:hypothetical protein PHMEG_00030379 [Phytophthora megakarya]